MKKFKNVRKEYQNLNTLLIYTTGKRFESNNKSIALNILHLPHNTKKICHAYKLKSKNSTRRNQVILLMITDGKNWHYLAVKSLTALLK